MKRAHYTFLSVLLSAFLITGCQGTSVSEKTPGQTADESFYANNSDAAKDPSSEQISGTDATTETTVPVSLTAPETNLVSDEMYLRATTFASSNVVRIAKIMKKASEKNEITVGVIGGSITEGYSSSSFDHSYAQIMKRWWETTFPDTKINYVNAGIGGTNSYLGVHRVENDLLSSAPDFVIVEFSVNDGDSRFYQKSYDNLVRRILESKNDPAVLLLFMTQENGTSAQSTHGAVGLAYSLPMISYKNAVLPEIENGTLKWTDISPDNIHPNDTGHAIAGELIWKYLNSVYEHMDEYIKEEEPVITPFVKDSYMDAELLLPGQITPDISEGYEEGTVPYQKYPDCWQTDEENSTLKFTVEAANIGLMYYRTTDGKSGQFEIFVDGESRGVIDADFSGGWGNYPETVQMFGSSEKAVHTIEIKRKDGSSGNKLSLLALMIS